MEEKKAAFPVAFRMAREKTVDVLSSVERHGIDQHPRPAAAEDQQTELLLCESQIFQRSSHDGIAFHQNGTKTVGSSFDVSYRDRRTVLRRFMVLCQFLGHLPRERLLVRAIYFTGQPAESLINAERKRREWNKRSEHP